MPSEREQGPDLDEFFNPKAVALIGSVNRNADPEKLKRAHRERWGDVWYLVNARGGNVGDIPVYRRVSDVPGKVTLAVISVSTGAVVPVLEDCGSHGVPYAVIFTAGFSEVGEEGVALEKEVADTARRYGIRVLGPNTNTNAFEKLPQPERLRGGRIGLITQSGHQGRPLVQSADLGFAFSRWVPVGNEVDLETADFIEYFSRDPQTRVIAGYLEGFRDPSKLRHAFEAANREDKPVVALKMGATRAGARMSISHTGHLAGSDSVTEGLFAQYGVTRVRDLDELLETSGLFAKLPSGTGPRCALYSISGGSGTLMAEMAELCGVPVPALSPSTRRSLRELIPDYLTVVNPVDNGAQFLLSAPEEDRRSVLELIAGDPGIDVVVVGLTGALGTLTDRFAEDLVAFADELPKPLVVTWNSFKTDEKGFSLLARSGLPMFRSFRGCFGALAAFADYERAKATFHPRKPMSSRVPPSASDAIGRLRAGDPAVGGGEGPRPLDSELALALLSGFGVPTVSRRVATNEREAVQAAREIGFPVVLKVASTDIPHRSDFGLVKLGVSSVSEVRSAYRDLIALAARSHPRAQIEGVEVQDQVPEGVEMIVGVVRDEVFGPSVLVGTGGVFAELLSDTVSRPLPVDRLDVKEMVGSLRARKLLEGARGRGRRDVTALVDLVLKVARLAGACQDQVAEVDLNPVVVTSDGAVVVDWLMVRS